MHCYGSAFQATEIFKTAPLRNQISFSLSQKLSQTKTPLIMRRLFLKNLIRGRENSLLSQNCTQNFLYYLPKNDPFEVFETIAHSADFKIAGLSPKNP